MTGAGRVIGYPSTLRAEVHEHQCEALAALERRGVHATGVAATTRQSDLLTKAEEPILLPEGFRIRDMCENRDFRQNALLYNKGFSTEETANALYQKLGPCWQKQWFHSELA